MTAIRRELRGPFLALVLLGLFARLLAPFAATAATERATYGGVVRASLCLPSGLPAPDAPDAPAAEPTGHCPLCRLPDADPFAAPAVAVLAAPGPWPLAAPPVSGAAEALLPPPRGPPPARAPPLSPTIG